MSMNILAAINKRLILLMIRQSHNEYEGVFLNNKCLRHSKIEFKVKTIEQELKKNSLSHFPDKIYVQNNGYNRLALGCQS